MISKLLIFLSFIISGCSGHLIDLEKQGTGSRVPTHTDHMYCRVKLFEELENIQEQVDPIAFGYAIFNRTGYQCKTYCKIRSRNIEHGKKDYEFDSPAFIPCGRADRYCSDGKCVKLGTQLKKSETTEPPKTITTPSSLTTNTQVTTSSTTTKAS